MKKSLKYGTAECDFVGELEDVAETKFKANLHGEAEAEVWEDALFAEYKAAGSPKPAKKWITEMTARLPTSSAACIAGN